MMNDAGGHLVFGSLQTFMFVDAFEALCFQEIADTRQAELRALRWEAILKAQECCEWLNGKSWAGKLILLKYTEVFL